MSRFRSALPALVAAGLAGAALTAAAAEGQFPGIGRPATPKEIAAWDIDVRPDFKGLPPGSGSVAKGQEIWEAKCESCHGVFGESNQTFSPLVGGTEAKDIETGRVARLTDPAFPGRTTLMKVSTVSTLFDYIRRAMPWNAPKSLSVDEVYAVTAYLLNLGSIVPENFTLSDKNIADVQKRLPNRNGMRVDHALWPGSGLATAKKPDVLATACMKDCVAEPKIGSSLPDHARNAHGNLSEQNRGIGAQRGADTTRPPGSPPVAMAMPAQPKGDDSVQGLTKRYACIACHGVENKIVGPGFREVAKKYAERGDAVAYLAGKIRSGGSGVWGPVEMPAQSLSDADAKKIAQWLVEGAK